MICPFCSNEARKLAQLHLLRLIFDYPDIFNFYFKNEDRVLLIILPISSASQQLEYKIGFKTYLSFGDEIRYNGHVLK